MRLLLLLLLLLVSLVHRSSQLALDKNEVFADFEGGFPKGSLITIYLMCIEPTGDGTTSTGKYAIDIELYQDFSQVAGHSLLFRPYCRYMEKLTTNYRADVNANYSSKTEENPQVWIHPESKKGLPWIRLDIYKLDDTTFLPFYQGFNAHPRTMPVTGDTTSVHIRPMIADQPTPTFVKDDVYYTRRTPNKYTPLPEQVRAALDQTVVTADTTKETDPWNLEHFKVGAKIRISALMISSDAAKANVASLSFYNEAKTWALALSNKWDDADNKVKLTLLTTDGTVTGISTATNKVDCTFTPTSTDLVHFKLMRPEQNKIKMRVYYVNDKAAGETCELVIPAGQDVNLDGPMTIRGVQSATILHMDVV